MENNEGTVIKLVQAMLMAKQGQAISPAIIDQNIDLVLSMSPAWGNGLDRQRVTDELIRRFSSWAGVDVMMKDDVGHKAWLVQGRKSDWRYWQRYSEYLEGRLSPSAIEALDKSTDMILGSLEDPLREGAWDRRGLVVGHVQSGKTASYTGLICKAADAGYKIIIVLAGLHNNLRSQTQIRLEEGFLGFSTEHGMQSLVPAGVGLLDTDPAIRPNCATTRADKGDFNVGIARGLAISPEERPWLFVVKKNKTPLSHLLRWIQSMVADAAVNRGDADDSHKEKDHAGIPNVRRTSTKFPVLVIDDEADHASVDTKEHPVNEDGTPDDEHDPTTINKLIRRILYSFSRSAYVGYTATPFANVFIHRSNRTVNDGSDLFPSSFILNLSAPSNYIGPARVFGRLSVDGRRDGLPLVRPVDDYATNEGKAGWMPHSHKAAHRPMYDGRSCLPPSVVEAVDAFIIACALRKFRGDGKEHCSMLVHVTRYTDVQELVYEQIDDHVQDVRRSLLRNISGDVHLNRLQGVWLRDFAETSKEVRRDVEGEACAQPASWELLVPEILAVIPDIQVRKINGTAKDVLDYADNKDIGLKVIAVGGDKLARGLTLEGLCVSYFLRASKMYDTLMQMGRWFGYRPGYLDLCRLYTTSELIEWFGHIADASEELREEFDVMADTGATPQQYGLKVQSHPVLMVTSRLKMRTAKSLMLSFSGEVLETVSMFKDEEVLKSNLAVTRELVAALGTPTEAPPERKRQDSVDKWGGFYWADKDWHGIVDFLARFKTHPSAYKVNGALISSFISEMAAAGELTKWSVLLVSVKNGSPCELASGVTVSMPYRKGREGVYDGYAIGRLLDPKDESIVLDAAEWAAALDLTRKARHKDGGRSGSDVEPVMPSGPAIRMVWGGQVAGFPGNRERGLLILYVLDPGKAGAGFKEAAPPIVAFGISFPASTIGKKVEYKVDHLRWREEFGDSE
ncbi:MAG: Z1 domain-containing protein [Pseudomonadota bacterium]